MEMAKKKPRGHNIGGSSKQKRRKIKTVKNKGIQICGIHRKDHAAKDLVQSFDTQFELNEIDPKKIIENE